MPPSAVQPEVLAETDTTSFTIPDRLTIENVAKRRAASGKLVAGIAAVADVQTFKGGEGRGKEKGWAKRWDHRLTDEVTTRKGNSLKNAARFLKTPGLISLGGGLPSSEYFPFDDFGAKVPSLEGGFSEADVRSKGVDLRAGKHDLREDKSAFDIATAFNYGQGHGSAQLLRWITEHTEIVNDPPYRDWSCTMSIGSTSATDMAFRMFCRPGDWILTEQYTFPAMVETARPMGIRVAAVEVDEHGMLASSLDSVLSNWDEVARKSPKPFLMYTVPTGQNPTGSTQPASRRREIYAVAQKHDLYLLEDEPYYFLQMEPYTGASTPAPPAPPSHKDFLASLVPSFLSMDIDGRVMRFDSFSKVIAPGSRVGWVTASEQICALYRTHADVSTQGPSGISQLLLYKLLDEHWGHAGYLDWLIHIRMEYTTRRDALLAACERFLPRDIVRWTPPAAGMFQWFEVDYTKHPAYPEHGMEAIEEGIFHRNIEHGTLLMRGSWFFAEDGAKKEGMFFRATYAAAKFDQIEEAIRRFGLALGESFGVEVPQGEKAVGG